MSANIYRYIWNNALWWDFLTFCFTFYRLKRLIVKTISINRYLQPYWKLYSVFFLLFSLPGLIKIKINKINAIISGNIQTCRQNKIPRHILPTRGVNVYINMLPHMKWEHYNFLFRSPGQLRAPAGRELVLDYIIERKRMDDLCGSIIDGRFREQKVGAWCIFSCDKSPVRVTRAPDDDVKFHDLSDE